nr:hypothetical protein [uncultured Anaerosporobacter sp.]
MATTRWTDCETNTLDRIIENITKVPKDDLVEDSTSYTNWTIKKVFDQNPQINLNNRKISYNFITYSYNQISPGTQPIEDRSVRKDGFVIVYSNGNCVSYIISRNSDGLKILRKMLNYTGRNEISKNVFEITSDFFIWLICKVYTGENVIETESETLSNLSIETIKGFKGDTEDLTTKVSAASPAGESVINIISTLSFLLESKNLNQIKMDLEYGKHENIELVLTNKGTIATDLSKYQGEFEDDSDKELLAKLHLLIYLEIMPILVQTYMSDIENALWNSEINIEFLKKVAEDLSDKVQKRVDALENK